MSDSIKKYYEKLEEQSKKNDETRDKLETESIFPEEIFFLNNNDKARELLKQDKFLRECNSLNKSAEMSDMILVNNIQDYDNLGLIPPHFYYFCTRDFYESCTGINLFHVTDLGLNLISPRYNDWSIKNKNFEELSIEQKDSVLKEGFAKQFNNSEKFSFERSPENLMNKYAEFKQQTSDKEEKLLDAARNKGMMGDEVGAKYSDDKAPMGIMLRQFPLALEGVAQRSLYGHNKYKEFDHDWFNFKRAPDAINQYLNATVRHLAEIGDDEDSLEHLKAAAWNILATLQITLEKK